MEGAKDRALANDESVKFRDCSLSVECDFDAGVARVSWLLSGDGAGGHERDYIILCPAGAEPRASVDVAYSSLEWVNGDDSGELILPLPTSPST